MRMGLNTVWVARDPGESKLSGWRHPLTVALTAMALVSGGAISGAMAQQRGASSVPPAAAPPAATPGAATARTELLTFDNWHVTCRDPKDSKDKRVCSGELSIQQEANGARRTLFQWLIGTNRDGNPVSALQFLPGIAIPPGLELKFADKPTRKVPIAVCEPTHCEAAVVMDDAFIRDASTATQADVLLQASDGRQVTFTVYLKGFPAALAAVRK